MIFADFELVERLHSGTSGILYRAHHLHLGRLVLLKQMSPRPDPQGELRKRFAREVKLAGQLSHPNLISAIHAGECDSVPYLVLEHVAGIDLEKYVRQHGILTEQDAIDYVIQAARGLAYLHEQGVYHRNVKPGNLLVDSDGHLRVTNLTFAGVDVDADLDIAETADLTRHRQVIGTAEYMAPEQAFDAKCADGRSDIYGLGCTLYYLLIGQPPYPDSDVERRIVAHTQRPIPSLRKSRLEISEGLDAIYHRMVAKMPADRYQSMSQVIADLQALRKELNKPRPIQRDMTTLVAVGVASAMLTLLVVTAALRIGTVNFFFPDR